MKNKQSRMSVGLAGREGGRISHISSEQFVSWSAPWENRGEGYVGRTAQVLTVFI